MISTRDLEYKDRREVEKEDVYFKEKVRKRKLMQEMKEAAENLRRFFPAALQRILDEDIYERIIQNVFDEVKDMIKKEKEKNI